MSYLLFLLFFDYSRLKKSGLCVAGAGPRVYRGCRLAISLSFLSADKPTCILIIPVNGILSFLPAAKHVGILSIPAGFAARLSQDYLLKRPVYYVFYPASDNRPVGSRGRRGSLLYPVIYISYYPSELYFFWIASPGSTHIYPQGIRPRPPSSLGFCSGSGATYGCW